jgi:hypothetical protein
MSFFRPAASLTATGWPAIVIMGLIAIDVIRGAILIGAWLFSFQ